MEFMYALVQSINLVSYISLVSDSSNAGFQVECPKYPGFCLAQQQRKREREIQMEKGAERKLFEYPFIEIYYSPQKVSSVFFFFLIIVIFGSYYFCVIWQKI